MACHTIVNNAVFYASLPAIKCEYPAYNVPAFYYTENWKIVVPSGRKPFLT